MMIMPLALLTLLGAQDWAGWRGPKGDGTSAETGFPTRWSPSEGLKWKVPVPGTGHSSPVIVGERLFLTTCMEESGERKLLCLSTSDGKLLWEKTLVTAPLERKHGLNSFASSTPVSDGKKVWVAFLEAPKFQVFCLDLEG